MNKNFLITTGGSGGHVIPATIIYDHLANKSNIIISTDKRGLNYLNKKNYKFKIINTPKLNNIFLLPFNLLIILFLTLKSIFLLKKQKILKVFSTGGYMSLPIILAARLLGLKIFLIEPNQVLGRANRFFLNFCQKIFCYSKEIKNFPQNFKTKIVIINPLVKKKIYECKPLNNYKNKFTLLVVGGSQGANVFDNNLKDLIVKISKRKSIKIIHQTSENNVSALNSYYLENNIENKIFSFTENFVDYIQQSDLCISRAGATTLAELSVMNVPFIAVPLPTSKDNHQFENANFYKNKDCCWLIEQTYFKEEIEETLNKIFDNKTNYLQKKENLKKLNYQNTWNNVNQKILEVINEN
jgi:UDP-N-acetylglucosamine--N-acetylmuramyl-(pentapeptide) pyrophosphoryl-undecaprenol N-acetylglucosamine transferase